MHAHVTIEGSRNDSASGEPPVDGGAFVTSPIITNDPKKRAATVLSAQIPLAVIPAEGSSSDSTTENGEGSQQQVPALGSPPHGMKSHVNSVLTRSGKKVDDKTKKT